MVRHLQVQELVGGGELRLGEVQLGMLCLGTVPFFLPETWDCPWGKPQLLSPEFCESDAHME